MVPTRNLDSQEGDLLEDESISATLGNLVLARGRKPGLGIWRQHPAAAAGVTDCKNVSRRKQRVVCERQA